MKKLIEICEENENSETINEIIENLLKKDLDVEMHTNLYEMCLRGEEVKEYVKNEILRYKKDCETKMKCFKEFYKLI